MYNLHLGSWCPVIIIWKHLCNQMVKSPGRLNILLSVFEMVNLPEPSRTSTGAFLNQEAPGGIRVSESSTI